MLFKGFKGNSFFNRIDFWFVLIIFIGIILRFSRINDFDNPYYTATSYSILKSWKNFFFVSSDPLGIVTVDKPPLAFWLQAVPIYIFGPEKWAVNISQSILGVSVIAILYRLIKPTFGRVAALVSSIIIAVIPASVIIDSRNEPDSLMMFLLLCSAVCMIKSVRSDSVVWLLFFGLLMGLAFNTKMLVAFIPLPIFYLYYFFARDESFLQNLKHLVLVSILLILVSFSWVFFIWLTPPENRPWIGSTSDNSIWTLVIDYNGFHRFEGFLGRPPQNLPPRNPPPQNPPFNISGDYNNFQGSQMLQMPPPLRQTNSGILGLLYGRIGAQTGWLLIWALILGVFTVSITFQKKIDKNLKKLFYFIRDDSFKAETFLWFGWLLLGFFIFGIANATDTHAYYLVALSIPISVIIGIGIERIIFKIKTGKFPIYLIPLGFISIVISQVAWGSEIVGRLLAGIVLVISILFSILLFTYLQKEKLFTNIGVYIFGLMIFIVVFLPAIIGLQSGGNIAGMGRILPAPVNFSQTNVPVQNNRIQVFPPSMNSSEIYINRIKKFVLDKNLNKDQYLVISSRSREVSPFILDDINAFSMNGFSGRDPVFTNESFDETISKYDYVFYISDESRRFFWDSNFTSKKFNPKDKLEIIRIINQWEDISLENGLPKGSLFLKFDQKISS